MPVFHCFARGYKSTFLVRLCISLYAGGVSLLLFLFLPSSLAQADDGQVYGFISFAVPMLTTSEENAADSEFTTVLVPLVREVGTTGQVLVTVEVSHAGSNRTLSPLLQPNQV